MNHQQRFSEQELADLLDEYRCAKQNCEEAPEESRARARERLQDIESWALEWIYGYLHHHLKPQVSGMFHRAGHDGEFRFTEVFNEVFQEVLERQPDTFWQRTSRQALAGWVSKAVQRDLLDRLKRPHQRDRLARAADGESDELTYIEDLAFARSDYFRSKHELDIVEAFEALKGWRDPRYEAVIRYRYLDGLTYAEIAVLLGTYVERAKQWHDEAIARLREFLGV